MQISLILWIRFFSAYLHNLDDSPLNEQLKLSIPLQLVEYFYMYQSMKLGSFEAVKETTLFRLIRGFSPLERLFFRYIDLLLWDIPMAYFVNTPEIIQLKDMVKALYFKDPAIGPSMPWC